MDDYVNVFEEFINKFNQEIKGMGHANLIIAGKTGVGKSTLINAAFRENVAKTGLGTPVTGDGEVHWFEKEGFPLRLYDTIGLELDEEKRRHSIDQIKQVCREAKRSNNPDRFIHAMWYCVTSDSDRLEKFEADYINEVSCEVDVVLVITKSYRKKHSERLLKAIEQDYPGLRVKKKVIVLAQDECPEDCEDDETPKKAYGMDTLVEVTAQLLPESAQKAWCNAQKASMNLKVSQAQALVLTTATASFGEGYVPVPFSDAALLVPTQVGMLAGITAIFGISIQKNLLKTIVMSLAGTAGTTFAGRTIVSNMLKMIPGVGTVVGGTISGGTAALLTTALGEAYIVIMKMIASGELSEKDLGTAKVQEQLQSLFKERLHR